MKVKLNKSIEGQLTFQDIRPNGVYICTYSPTGAYNSWVLIGVSYQDLFGIWAGLDSAIFCEETYNYKQFKFKEIQAELVEV